MLVVLKFLWNLLYTSQVSQNRVVIVIDTFACASNFTINLEIAFLWESVIVFALYVIRIRQISPVKFLIGP